ncbi:MAG: TldD/PmbA family protein [Acidimicrobiales bacterium]
MTVPESTRLARRLVGQAQPGEQIEVCAGSAVRTEVRVHGGMVESLTVAESRGVGVRVVVDGREGFAHAGTFDADVVDELVEEARDNAAFAEPDDRVGLAEPDGVAAVDLDPWDDRIASTSVDDKLALAVELERATIGADRRVRNVRTSLYADTRAESAIVSSLGIDGWDRGSSCSLSTSALIDDPDGSTRTGGAVDAAGAPQDLDVENVARLAVERGVQLIGAGPPTTGRPMVVLEPRFAATMLGIVAGMLSGERVVKGRTPFADRLGEAVAAAALSVMDDPIDPESLSASSFDGEGIACRRVPLITGGVLDGFLHDSRSARGLDTVTTGSALRGVRGTPSPGHRSLSVAPGEGDLERFISSIDDGLLVASLQGLHSGVNAVSGDLSVGVEGVMIRNGQLAEPIREGTLAGAIPRVLLDIAAVGADLERLPGGSLVPTLVLEGLTLGGGSAA